MAESRYIGKVRWFNKTKGYGMITREDNGIDVFVHFSNIATDGFKNLSEGEPVEFSITSYEKGVQATNVISISPSAQKTNLPALKVFLCHSSGDKPVVRDLYQRLKSLRVDPWLDEEKILPGQDWNIEITKAVRNSDIVIVCLSKGSISKTGYIQKEIKYALDVADEQPDGTIFIIPLKIEECEVPERLRRWQWVNLFDENGYQRLSTSLKLRAKEKGVLIS